MVMIGLKLNPNFKNMFTSFYEIETLFLFKIVGLFSIFHKYFKSEDNTNTFDASEGPHTMIRWMFLYTFLCTVKVLCTTTMVNICINNYVHLYSY